MFKKNRVSEQVLLSNIPMNYLLFFLCLWYLAPTMADGNPIIIRKKSIANPQNTAEFKELLKKIEINETVTVRIDFSNPPPYSDRKKDKKKYLDKLKKRRNTFIKKLIRQSSYTKETLVKKFRLSFVESFDNIFINADKKILLSLMKIDNISRITESLPLHHN